jgi:hypothetical protein
VTLLTDEIDTGARDIERATTSGCVRHFRSTCLLSLWMSACRERGDAADTAASSESSDGGSETADDTEPADAEDEASDPTGAAEAADETGAESETAGESEGSDGSGDGSTTGDAVVPPFTISNAVDFGELAPTGLVLGPPNGTFDTDADCTDDASLGICEPVQTDTIDACVCRADEIVIGDLQIVGTRALVLLAWTSVDVLGVLDVGGAQAFDGPGAWSHYLEAADFAGGGVGGSYGSFGGENSAEPYGEPELVPLVGGMSGQEACGGQPGGGAGGALQISAGERITVDGVVNAGGGGGTGGWASDSCNGGAGGGSGGAILLESVGVEVYGMVAANGGGAGSGGTTSFLGNDGADAVSIASADGGPSQSEAPCALGNTVYSGYGGAGATASQSAGDGGVGGSETICFDNADVYSGNGGGGGGVGRVRVNTELGAQGCICTGDFSPATTFGELSR